MKKKLLVIIAVVIILLSLSIHLESKIQPVNPILLEEVICRPTTNMLPEVIIYSK